MSDLVNKIHNFLATDARATIEPGGMIAFSDDKIRLIADTAGSMRVRIFDAVTGERVFLGNDSTDVPDNAAQWESYIDELSNDSPKALVGPDKEEVTLVTPSAPEPITDSSDFDREVKSIQKEQEKINNDGGAVPVDKVVNTLFPPKHDHNKEGHEEVVSDSK